jgi:hypothetical protein
MSEAFEPKILAFLCNWCSYAGADLAGVSRFQYPPQHSGHAYHVFGPRSVREMAGSTGLSVYAVSLRLNNLERRGLADLKGYEGTTPRFIRLAV